MLKSLGMLEQVLALGEPFTHFDLRRSSGQLISAVSLKGFSTPAVCIHRADLHGALRHPLPPACLEANRRLVSFSQDDGGVVARFAGGHEVAGIGLIGADGINSVVRSQLHGAAAPLYQGYCIWRGIAPETAGVLRGRISESWGYGQRFGVMPWDGDASAGMPRATHHLRSRIPRKGTSRRSRECSAGGMIRSPR